MTLAGVLAGLALPLRTPAAVQSGGPYAVEHTSFGGSATLLPVGAAPCQMLAVAAQPGPVGEGAAGGGSVIIAAGILSSRPVWDTDGDGVPDDEDADLDADGIPNAIDPLPYDTDNDGLNNLVDEDDDNDGLSDLDEAMLGTDPLRADTDGDGYDDGTEVRVLGTDPRDAGDFLRFAEVRMAGGALIVTWRASPGIEYWLQRASTLAPGGWSDVGGSQSGPGPWLTVTAAAPAGAGFWRVRVSAGGP